MVYMSKDQCFFCDGTRRYGVPAPFFGLWGGYLLFVTFVHTADLLWCHWCDVVTRYSKPQTNLSLSEV